MNQRSLSDERSNISETQIKKSRCLQLTNSRWIMHYMRLEEKQFVANMQKTSTWKDDNMSIPWTDPETLWPSYTAPPSWSGTIWSLESSSWLMRWERGISWLEHQWNLCLIPSVSDHLAHRHWIFTRTSTEDRSITWFISWTSPSSPLTWLFISSQYILPCVYY